MILEKETYEKFGYYPSDLSPHSAKPILAACDDCDKIRETPKCGYRPLCKSCVKKGVRHLLWGKHHSEKTKQKIRGENNPNWKGGNIKRICIICGTIFEAYPCEVRKGRGCFCSHSCVRQGRKRLPKYRTKPELIFEQICKKRNLPFKYTGDGAFWIGGNPAINPDFIECNGKKIAVEIFGDYWHSPLLNRKLGEKSTLTYRKRALKEYG